MELPEEFWEWQIEKRKKGIKAMIKGKNIGYEAHLPVMATYGDKINLAVKGTGLVPKDEAINFYIKECVAFIDKCKKKSWKKTTKKRLEFLLDLQSSPEDFDKSLISSIEMHGTKTFNNAKKNNKCSLMFNDYDYKTMISFQVDCEVEMVHFPDPVYKYAVLMHSMFHSLKQDYPCVYKFKVLDVLDKRP